MLSEFENNWAASFELDLFFISKDCFAISEFCFGVLGTDELSRLIYLLFWI